MSTPYDRTGRVNQKQRTREALVTAVRDLIARGTTTPTVEEAAVQAQVSRTTAYRYFPTQRALLVAAHPEVDLVTLLPDDAGDDPEQRVLEAVREFIKLVIETEPQQRTMLRLSLSANDSADSADRLPLRQGRAIGWFVDALAPLRPEWTSADVHRLAVAIRSAVGIESLVWLVDVAGLSRKESAEVMSGTARALVRDAIATDDQPRG